MGDGVNIDTLEIEVEASSEGAVEKINALTESLRKLQEQTKQKFGDIAKKIETVGDSASTAHKKTAERKAALNRATGESKESSGAGQSVRDQYRDVTEALMSAQSEYENLKKSASEAFMFWPDSSGEAIKELESVKEEIRSLGEQYDELGRKIRELGPQETIKNLAPSSASSVISDLKKDIDFLNKQKLNLTNELAKADIQAVKTDGKLADMRRNLEDFREKAGMDQSALASIKEAEDRIGKFASSTQEANEYLGDMHKALSILKDYKFDPSTAAGQAEIKETARELRNATQRYKELTDAAKLAGEVAKNAMAEAKASVGGIKKPGKTGKGQVGVSGVTEQEAEVIEPAESLREKLSLLERIQEIINGITSRKFGKDFPKIDIFKDVKGSLDNSIKKKIESILPKGADSSVKALTGAFEKLTTKALGFAKAHPLVAGAILAVGTAVKAVVGQMRKLASSAFSAAKKGFELLASAARKLAASIKDLLKSGIANLGKGIAGIGKSVVRGVIGPFTKAAEKISRWKKMLGSALFYSTVFRGMTIISNGIKEGIENLYQYSKLVGTEFAPAMNSLATSALYLKNSLGAMAAPLIQALAPAIDFIIDKFVALLNVIGKVFAALTGKSVYTQAKKHAVEYGEAAKDASKATKDFLLGIDELNVLNDNSGGAGGAASDFGDMFEEVEVPNDIKDWAAQIRDAIKNGDWRKVGEIVADKLNEVVDSWDSYAWGARLGELINNGLNVAYGFLTTFDFEQLGRKVADAINGIFDTVDWDLLGRTFAAGWNGLFDFIYGFATKLDWRGIGSSIADAINGAIDEFNFERAAEAISKLVTGIFTTFRTILQETHWYTLGTELANFINNIDWYGAIYGVLTTITAALDALRMGIDGFLSGWDWRDMALKISTAINDAFNSISWGILGKSIGNGIKTALAFVSETLDGIGWRDIGNKIGQFIIGLDWVGTLAGLANVIVSGINAAIKTVSVLISTIQPHIKDWARDLGNKFMEAIRKIEWADAGKALSDGIEAALDFMIEFMQTVDWDEVGQHIAEFLENIDWDTLLTKWGQLLGEIMNAKMKVLDVSGILEVGANIVKGLLSGILTEFDAGGGITGWIKRHLFDAFIGAIKWLFGIHSPSTVMAEIGGFLVAGLLQGIQDTISDVVGFFEDIWNGILGTFETIGALIVSVTTGDWQTVRDIITGAWESSRTATDENLSKIQATTSEKFGLIETDALDKFGKTKAHALDCWSGIKTDTDDKLSQIRNKAKTEFESIETESAQKFKATKKNITDAWEGARNSTDTNLPSISQTASTHFKKIHDDSSSTFQEVKRIVKDSWDDVERNTKTSWQNNEKTVGDKMKEIKKDIENPFTGTDGLVEKARNWGRDIIENLSSGMEGKRHRLDTATRNVARDISSYLHFSEPDIGPLSDFHTYMPDMLQLMAKGIKDNSHLAVNAASDLADSMSRVFRDIEPVQPQYTVRQNPYTTMPDAFAQAQSAGASISNYNSTTTNVSNDNGDVIAALKAGFQALIETINSQDYSTHLDGKTLMQSVERAQRQRGVNIMEGGVLG